MITESIQRRFQQIGARAKVRSAIGRRGAVGVSIDIGHDRHGEFFDIAVSPVSPTRLAVVDTRSDLRHLLLMSDQTDGKHKFLCGHDERHWFVAAVPERAAASNVAAAFDALKPEPVRQLEERLKVKPSKRNRRRNEAFVRQGEWFFVPVPKGTLINEQWILRNEPIFRGDGGKPHRCEELVRQGGELIYVSPIHATGLTETERANAFSRRPQLRSLPWTALRRNPGVFVRGKIRHADHKTTLLDGWHEVLMNTENQSAAMRHVAFID